MSNRDTHRGLVLSGARQVGKTTLFRQTIRRLVREGYPPTRLLYATFDHAILKLAGVERVVRAWEELFPPDDDAGLPRRLLFLDEVQYDPNWATWMKHQVDFSRQLRVAVTGSAAPLHSDSVESGVGRWETIPLPTLSFGEYLRLRDVKLPDIPEVRSLRTLFDASEGDLARLANAGKPLVPHFHDYLLRGGFPEPALVNDLTRCQRLLREDIVDKVLKRDMTALYGVRKVLEAEKIFLYLCYHDGGILDMAALSRELDGVNKQTAQNLLDLFEATHLVHRLKPFGYGKEVLRGKDKVYLADAAIPGAVMLLGRRLLEKADRLGAAVETAFFKHVFTRFYADTPRFSYWQDRKNKDREVDLIAEVGDRLIPFEVKYRDSEIGSRQLKGLRLFLEANEIDQGYVVAQRWQDLRLLDLTSARHGHEREQLDARVLLIPAPLACYWLSA